MTDFEILFTEKFGSRPDGGSHYCEECENPLDPRDENPRDEDGNVFCSERCKLKYIRRETA